MFEQFGLDTEKDTPGRTIVRHIGESLVEAMEEALAGGEPEAAQKVASECVVHAETKDHANWELIGLVAEKSKANFLLPGRHKCARKQSQTDGP